MATDPVCGMVVDEKNALAQGHYQGVDYYFCSKACLERFSASPKEFIVPLKGERARELYEHLWFLTRYLYSSVASDQASQELTTSELLVVEALGRTGKTIVSKVAAECALSLSTMTGVIDRLVKKECVTRERSEEDRRVVLIELTEKGQRAYQERLEADMRLVLNMLAALMPNEQKTMLGYLRKITGSVKV